MIRRSRSSLRMASTSRLTTRAHVASGISAGSFSRSKLTSVLGRPLYRFGKVRPMKAQASSAFFVAPQIKRFLRRIDAIARRAVEIDIHVHAMLAAEFDGLVNLLQRLLLRFSQSLGSAQQW